MTLHLLLVDDEADAIELFRQSFRREIRSGRLTIQFATSADEALRLLAGDGIGGRIVVLSDINMPGMNGLDLLREVKQRWPGLTVIMVSAYGDPQNRQRAAELGASAFVVKPVDFRHLKEALGFNGFEEGI